MTDFIGQHTTTEDSVPATVPAPAVRERKAFGRPFQPGRSGNPSGRPKIEPRVRRYARKYDRAMCKVLAQLAMDPKAPPSERRHAAMDLIAVGSGRPALLQEIANRGAPLVNIDARIIPSLPRDLSQQDALAWLERIAPAPPDDGADVKPPVEPCDG
ncbi:MAG: hypothetical protein ACREUL_17765 [Steroidobacteraceae bacterium]